MDSIRRNDFIPFRYDHLWYELNLKIRFGQQADSVTNIYMEAAPTSPNITIGVSEYRQDYTRYGQAGWYEYRSTDDGITKFVKHGPTQAVQWVLFKFISLTYGQNPGETLDPTEITFKNQTGFWYNGYVSFLLPIKLEQEYEITASDFNWPDYSYVVPYGNGSKKYKGHSLNYYSRFTNDVLSVQFGDAWSDQFSDVDVNRLPGQSGSGGYDYLLIGARSDGNFYAKTEVTITPDSDEIRDRLIFNWAGLEDGQYYIDTANNATISGDEVVLSGGEKLKDDHVFIWGVDANSDGELQESEVSGRSEHVFRPVTQTEYTTERVYLQVYVLPGLLAARTAYAFMYSFLYDSTPSGATAESSTISANEPTHNIGVIFTSSGSGALQKNVFDAESTLSDEVYSSSDFQDALQLICAANKTAVQNYFAANPTDTEETFTWTLPTTITFANSFNLFNSFGTATLAGTIDVTVNSDLEVIEIHTQCDVTDLYDWDYENGDPDSSAARVQAGYDTLGSGGHMFRVHVDVDKEDLDFSYSFE